MLKKKFMSLEYSFFRRQLVQRYIHVSANFLIIGQKNIPGAIILQTENNIKDNEPYADYNKRSMSELVSLLPKSFESKQLLVLKINQSVISPTEWIKKSIIKPIYSGHVLAGIFQCDKNSLILIKGTFVSKTPQGMQHEDEILSSHFFSDRHRYTKATAHFSDEFYLIIDLARTTVDLEKYKKRVSLLFQSKEPYDLEKSACAQAVYYAVTGLLPLPRISTQTAATNTIFDILKHDGDIDFHRNLRTLLIKSKLPQLAYDRGKIYENAVNNSSMNNTSFVRNRGGK